MLPVPVRAGAGLPWAVVPGARFLSVALLLVLAPALGLGACRHQEAEFPAPRAGADRIGVDAGDLLPRFWRGPAGPEAPLDFGPGGPKATLLRWWTDGCPYCEQSLPALEALREEFASRGLLTIGVYHPKPPVPVARPFAQRSAEARGYSGPLALDTRWAALRALWLDTGERDATSFSILLDSRGVIRFVHPGPEFHASDKESHERCNADFLDLQDAIAALLAE